MARTCSASDGKSKEVKSGIFEIPHCDSLVEILTTTQLPAFFYQTNSHEVANKHQQPLLYFQK